MPTLEEFRARGPRPPRPRASIFTKLKDFAVGATEIPLAGLATIGDVMSRPQLALSEGYGAYESGEESTLSGAMRGLTEGDEGRKYPTFGERIVPPEEGEGLGRSLARLGAEWVTDPTFLLAGPITRGVGRVGLGAGRMLKATKAGKAIAGSDAAQTMARMVMPMKYNLEKWGGSSGANVSLRAEYGLRNASEKIERESLDFLNKLKEFGLHRPSDAARRVEAADVIESGMRNLSNDDDVNKLAFYLRDRFRATGDYVGRFSDPFKNGIKVEGRAFQQLPDYYPQILKNDLVQEAMSRRGLSTAAAKLAKTQKITTDEAIKILRQHTGRNKVAGNIEMPRLKNMSHDLLERDPAVAFPRYVSQVHKRLETAKQFGLKNEILEKELEQAVRNGMSPKTAEDARRAITGHYVESALGLDVIAPKIMAFQVLSKMGPTSALANISQQLNIMVADGIGNYVRGLVKLADKGVRQRSLEAFQVGMRSQLDMLVGEGASGKWPTLASKWLGVSGFTGAEKFNRMSAYAGGVASAEQIGIKALGSPRAKIPETLKKLLSIGHEDNPHLAQIIDREWTYFQTTRKFSPVAERGIGIAASNNSQFTTRFLDLPPMWQTPEMRIAMQFRGFIYQQSRFLAREVAAPAIKWIDTGGKEGSIGPAVRALTLYPIGGHGVAGIREAYSEMLANKMGVSRKFKRKTDPGSALAQMIQDSMMVGSMGMAGDMLDQASQGGLLDWAAGPTVSGLAYAGEKGITGAGKMLFDGDYPGLEDIITEGIRVTPGRRAVPLAPSELGEWAASGLRGLGGGGNKGAKPSMSIEERMRQMRERGR